MKNIRMAAMLAAVAALVLAGCRNPVQPPCVVETQTGTLSLTITTQGPGRTIMPPLKTGDCFYKVRLWFVDGGGNALDPKTWDGLPIMLAVGTTWSMTATAYLNAADEDPVAASVEYSDIELFAGETEPLTVTLRPIARGSGMFRWSIGFPPGADRARLEVDSIGWDEAGNEIPGENDGFDRDFDLADPAVLCGDGRLCGYDDGLYSGTYRVILTLTKEGKSIRISAVLHVWQGMESVFDPDFGPEYFTASLFDHFLRAWNAIEHRWEFDRADMGIEAGDFYRFWEIVGVDPGDFHDEDETGIIHWFNKLTYNAGDPMLPGDGYDLKALVDASRIGMYMDADFLAEHENAGLDALRQTIRGLAPNDTYAWLVRSGDNRVVANVGDDDGVYYSVQTSFQYDFTVTFQSASGTVVEPQTVSRGGTVTAPDNIPATRPWLPVGLWRDELPMEDSYTFDGWLHGNAAWDIGTDTVTGDMTLTANWTAPVSLVEANNVAAAVAHVNANDDPDAAFILAIDRDVNSAGQNLYRPYTNLTIVGIGGQRTISHTGTGRLFHVGPASGTINSISLTLGNDIILMGREQGPDFIRVQNGGRLYMEANARITGHTTTQESAPNGAGAAVFLEHNSTLTMRDDAEITGNRANNADAITARSTAGGVFLRRYTSNLVMEGGSITGNFRGESTPADIVLDGAVPEATYTRLAGYDGIGAIVRRITISFNSAGGSLVAEQIVGAGYPITPPADPTDGPAWDGPPATPGLWLMTQVFEWRHNGVEWDFDNPVTADMTLTAHWVDPTDPVDLELTGTTLVQAAVNHVNANAAAGAFTLAIDADVDSGPNTLNALHANLTIIGIGPGDDARQIRFVNTVNTQRLFDLNPANNNVNAASLTLGNRITLVGRTQGEHGQTNNSNELIRVQNGARLYMEEGSKITGHTSTAFSVAGGLGAAVLVAANGTFTMRGGTITGNRGTAGIWTDLAGGVSLTAATSRFHMEGGSVSGNTRGAAATAQADVFLNTNVTTFVLSGDATVGHLTLNRSGAVNPSVTLGSGNGGVYSLDLMFGNADIGIVIDSWIQAERILQAADSHTLILADLDRIASARFIGNTDAVTQDVAATHEIVLVDNAGVLRANP